MLNEIESILSYLTDKEKFTYLFSFFFLIVCNFYIFIANKRFLKLNKKKNNGEKSFLWQHSLMRAAERPFQLAFVLLGVYFVASILIKKYSYEDKFQAGAHLLLLYLMILVLFNFLKGVESNFASGRKQKLESEEKTNVEGFFLFAKIFILFIGLLITLQLFNVNVSSILAIGGIGGILFGFTMKDLFENLFSGLVLFISRKFEIGDYIKTEKVEGTVEHINPYSTLVRHIDQTLFAVPNHELTRISIQNFSHMTHQLLQIKIPIGYEDFNKLEDILREIDKILRNHRHIDAKREIYVFLDGIREWALDILVRAYVKLEDSVVFDLVKHDIYLKILKMVEDKNANLYLSTSKIYLSPDTSHPPYAKDSYFSKPYDEVLLKK